VRRGGCCSLRPTTRRPLTTPPRLRDLRRSPVTSAAPFSTAASSAQESSDRGRVAAVVASACHALTDATPAHVQAYRFARSQVPQSLWIVRLDALVCSAAGDWENAARSAQLVLASEGNGRHMAVTLATSLAARGHVEEAVETIEYARSQASSDCEPVLEHVLTALRLHRLTDEAAHLVAFGALAVRDHDYKAQLDALPDRLVPFRRRVPVGLALYFGSGLITTDRCRRRGRASHRHRDARRISSAAVQPPITGLTPQNLT